MASMSNRGTEGPEPNPRCPFELSERSEDGEPSGKRARRRNEGFCATEDWPSPYPSRAREVKTKRGWAFLEMAFHMMDAVFERRHALFFGVRTTGNAQMGSTGTTVGSKTAMLHEPRPQPTSHKSSSHPKVATHPQS
ncbi:hypothetical protein S40285_10481 [Stachybotrys chlorohalonatus IBT 40285]|uniref:Uncharacterized protein n=1 Tax=Stachybotrys chlorohalonatus (strain IBT 40285) TaxID=1283841 RepID=A0A084QN14_STAC4|nr:hypothetical protein S40285_10481 [Stachybotrys chlorohalonata IBT 40285]